MTNSTLPDLKGGIPETQRWSHSNSKEAFKSLSLKSRHREIYELCLRENRPLTDRNIKELLEYSDMNSVRPRISELIDFGYLKECGKIRDSRTGKKVRQVAARHREHQQTLFPKITNARLAA